MKWVELHWCETGEIIESYPVISVFLKDKIAKCKKKSCNFYIVSVFLQEILCNDAIYF